MQTDIIYERAAARQQAHVGGEARMRLRYGFNAAASELPADALSEHLRLLHTGVVRVVVSAHSKTDWAGFASLVKGILDAGARPMVAFPDLARPYDDAASVRQFAGDCAAFVKECLEHWGAGSVRQWYWAIGNKPNSEWDSGGLTFDQYRRFYEASATAILSALGSTGVLIGGPAVDAFQPFWFDWLWRFVHEIDPALIGFVSWHQYGDWREHGTWGAPADDQVFRGLILSRTPEYEVRARMVARLLKGSHVLNVCDELNAHSHWSPEVSARFNQTAFGAAYYVSALIHLMRGGADLELFWSALDSEGRYGALDRAGAPAPVYHAKRLCTQHVRFGDRVSFPPAPGAGLDVVLAQGDDGRRGAVIVHRRGDSATYPFELAGLEECRTLMKIDSGTGNRIVEASFQGRLSFEGYGVAVVTDGEGDQQ